MDFFNYRRRESSVVRIGDTPLGGANPIRVQSMANVSTMDTAAAVEQAIRMIEAGAEYVRFTAQGEREARNLHEIREALNAHGYTTPIIADIHFNPKAADVAALYVEKVRINPGNYIDKARKFETIDYSDEEYADELRKIRERFTPFLRLCREHGTAIRIGVNHGSLSDRIMSRYGDTPEGMVESCMEFLRICRDEAFDDVVVSIKASNTVVMIRTVRLLVLTMDAEGMKYPLHLGVTEAGDSVDGRIKSAIGIGTLLADNIGDTIRVSLSEEPEAEIPVAQKLIKYINVRARGRFITATPSRLFDPIRPSRRKTRIVDGIGGDLPPLIAPEIQNCRNAKFIELRYDDLNDTTINRLKTELDTVVILSGKHINCTGEMRAFMHRLLDADCDVPVILRRDYSENDPETLMIKAAVDFGSLLVDGFGDGIILNNTNDSETPSKFLEDCMLSILQATRVRISSTEYISCPGCGRTLFDLQKTIAQVKAATSHLKGTKIAVMGCIVNGPGEMADADYGYVGAGRGRISLYKGKECVLKNIPEEEAVERLLELINTF